MSALARPSVQACLLSLVALTLQPALDAQRWLPGRELVLVAALLLALVGLVGRALAGPVSRGDDRVVTDAGRGRLARARAGAWLVALGATGVVAGLGLDGLRGLHGELTLRPGGTSGNFDEIGPAGRSLGLRPLGFRIGAEGRTAAGVSLLLPRGGAELTPRRALAVGGLRLADPRFQPTGEAASLRLAASEGERSEVVELTPGAPARAGDLVVALERYFPDFALDANQRPFTRSLEPRNPAALLSVERGGEVHRAFVLGSMPGLHRVEPLGLAFSLLDVTPEQQVTIAVHEEPGALAVLLGGLALVAGLGLGVSSSVRPAEAGEDGPLVAGCGLLFCLLLVDSGRVLEWSFGLASAGGREALPGVGSALGLALLAALAGVLLLAAQSLAGGVDVTRPARRALAVAALASLAGVVLALARLGPLDASFAEALPIAGVACGGVVLAAALWGPSAPRVPALVPAATAGLALVALGVGVSATLVHGSYATPALAACSAAFALGLAACERTGLGGLRRLALLLSVVLLLVRPN